MIIDEDEIGPLFNAMGLRIDGLENRWRRFENDDAIANMMQGGIEWIGPSSIAVEELAALAVKTGDLEVNGTLTLGPGGKIEDDDGSVWDQTGITLQSADTETDRITFARDGFDKVVAVSSYIDSGANAISLRAQPPDATPYQKLSLVADTTPGTSYLMYSVPGGGIFVVDGLGNLFASGYLEGSVLRLSETGSAPSAVAGEALLYVDSADGDLKVKFGNGTVKVIATNP